MTREGETPHSRWMSCVMKLKEGLAFPKVFFHNNKKNGFPKKFIKLDQCFLDVLSLLNSPCNLHFEYNLFMLQKYFKKILTENRNKNDFFFARELSWFYGVIASIPLFFYKKQTCKFKASVRLLGGSSLLPLNNLQIPENPLKTQHQGNYQLY